MPILNVGRADFKPGVLIFDKDGTLIDFDAMWGIWITDLATRLEAATGLAARAPLYTAMGFDAEHQRVLGHGKLAVAPMALLYDLTIEVMQSCGATPQQAGQAVAEAWFIPDPVHLAKPFGDLKGLFTKLKNAGVKVAIATTDDRLPTIATLQGLGVWELVDRLICADDCSASGLAVKPAPDMVHAICQQLNVPVINAVMVGDSIADLQMGSEAGVGLKVGVLSGVSNADALAPYADVLIDSVQALL